MSLDRTPPAGLSLNLAAVLSQEQQLRQLLLSQAARRLGTAAEELSEAAQLAKLAEAIGDGDARELAVIADEAAELALQARVVAGEDEGVMTGEAD